MNRTLGIVAFAALSCAACKKTGGADNSSSQSQPATPSATASVAAKRAKKDTALKTVSDDDLHFSMKMPSGMKAEKPMGPKNIAGVTYDGEVGLGMNGLFMVTVYPHHIRSPKALGKELLGIAPSAGDKITETTKVDKNTYRAIESGDSNIETVAVYKKSAKLIAKCTSGKKNHDLLVKVCMSLQGTSRKTASSH